jgi:hypothetical protein
LCLIRRSNAGVVVRDDRTHGTSHGRQVRDAARLSPGPVAPLCSGSASRNSLTATFDDFQRGPKSAEAGPFSIHITEWSGRRGSSSRPLPWQGTALILYSGGVDVCVKAATYPQFPRGATLTIREATQILRRSTLITKRGNRLRRREMRLGLVHPARALDPPSGWPAYGLIRWSRRQMATPGWKVLPPEESRGPTAELMLVVAARTDIQCGIPASAGQG